MTDKNGNVKWTQFIIFVGIASTLLGTIWVKLEKIDDTVGQIQTDIAVIKSEIRKSMTITNNK